MLRIDQIILPLSFDENVLRTAAAREIGIRREEIGSVTLLKKAVDARDKSNVRFSVNIGVTVRQEEKIRLGGKVSRVSEKKKVERTVVLPEKRPVVIGLGPCGLFAALRLARAHARPIVIERGKCVDERMKDTAAFAVGMPLDEESNILFGEGGAGAFSDGKLTTGIKHPYCADVIDILAEHGAPEEIRIAAKPHIGTDKLPYVVKSIREEIESLGGEVLFETCLRDIVIENDRLTGIRCTRGGEVIEIESDKMILATGHSARDIYAMLRDKGVRMEKKPFAIGARIEHLREDIDRAQYGRFAGHPALGAADYKLATHLKDGRGVYTFCMCPGGEIVASSSEQGRLAVNGMSRFARDARNSNSALLVSVTPDDFPGEDVLSGVEFQRKWEEKAFLAGGKGWKAPAQLVGDLLKKRASKAGGRVLPSYPRGVEWGELDACLPRYVVEDMRLAIPEFGRKLCGFDDPESVLTGVETRSSSPVRVLRNEVFEAEIKGLYPAGEGAGYAGGITSAAVDGMRAADAVLGATDAL